MSRGYRKIKSPKLAARRAFSRLIYPECLAAKKFGSAGMR
jgi:hypothetical protein